MNQLWIRILQQFRPNVRDVSWSLSSVSSSCSRYIKIPFDSCTCIIYHLSLCLQRISNRRKLSNRKNRKQIVAPIVAMVKYFTTRHRINKLRLISERAPIFCNSQMFWALFISTCHILNHRKNISMFPKVHRKQTMAYGLCVWHWASVFNGISQWVSELFICLYTQSVEQWTENAFSGYSTLSFLPVYFK